MTKEWLKDQCEAEFENIKAVLDELFTVVRPDKDIYSVAELAAIASFLHNIYNGIENILKRILYYKQVNLQADSTWHKNLPKAATHAGIIPDDLHTTLSSYLSFRRFFVHAYSFTLRWQEIKPLVEGIRATLGKWGNSKYLSLSALTTRPGSASK